MQVAICDDNKLFLAGFEEQVRGIPLVNTVFTFSDYNTLLFSIDEGRRYDAILLDIEWERERTGIDIAEELHRLSPHTKVIYVTGNGERYAQRIFLHKANLSGFLTKPVDTGLLAANLHKVAQAIPYEAQPTLVLRQKGSAVSIPLREIFYIESRGHTVVAHTTQETVVSYEKLESVAQTLPLGFYQCHKSFIVNMNQIRRFQATHILLKNGAIVPVSRARFAKVKDAYFDYMGHSF